MLRITSTLVLLALSSTSLATANFCSQPIVSKFVPLLQNYAPAESWCSAIYPLPRITSTSTTTTDGGTTTITDTTVTVTATVTATPANKRRRGAKTTKTTDTKASLCSVLERGPASVAKSVCSCIETPQTTTVVTAVPAPLSTTHTTATETTTTTITPSPSPSCTTDQSKKVYSSDDHSFDLECGYTYSDPSFSGFKVVVRPLTDVYACLNNCDHYGDCCAVAFDRRDGTCHFLQSTSSGSVIACPAGNSKGSADPNFDVATRN